MKRFATQFKKQAQSVKLRAGETRDLRERVVTYMEYHPLPKTANTRTSRAAGKTPVSNDSYWFVPLRNRYVKAFFGVTAVLVFLVVPVLAERSNPGDMLYSIKVGFNEEVQSSLPRSPYEQVEWESERLSRRLAEAQELVREGRLTDEQETRVADAVRSRSESARASIEHLRESDADEAAIAELTLAALLDVHSTVLAAYASSSATSTDRESVLASAIADSRGARVAGSTVRPSYEGLLARIEIESNRAYELFANTVDAASEDDLASVSRRLEDIDRKAQAATEAHQAGNEQEAVTLLAESLTATRKVITFLSDLDVRQTVSLETLVPVEYTTPELTAILTERQATLEAQYNVVSDAVAAKDELEPATAEKVTAALEQIPTRLASSTTAITEERFTTARDMLQSVQDELDDIATLLDITYRATNTPATTTPAAATTTPPEATSAPATTTPATSTPAADAPRSDAASGTPATTSTNNTGSTTGDRS